MSRSDSQKCATSWIRSSHWNERVASTSDDEPTPLSASTIQDEHAAWGKILRALTDIQAELDQIEYAEHQRIERFTPSDELSRRAGREHFTLEEAKRWIGRTVITKAAFDVDHR